MKPQFTPGPWLVNFEQNKFDSRRSKVQVVDGSSASLNNGGLPLVLANVNAMPFNDESVPLANATLIASAPEMLEVLALIYANAGESPEWIRARIAPVIEKAIGGNL
jgi:hypothetical protein